MSCTWYFYTFWLIWRALRPLLKGVSIQWSVTKKVVMVKLSIITNTLLFLALPLLKSSILLKWLNHHRLRFAVLLWVNGLAGEGVRVHQLLAGLAVNQSRLASDTGNDRGLVVVVPGIRPVPVALVLLGTLEVEQVFRAAAQLIRPIAALDAFIVEETSRLTLSSTGHTPGALAVENVARFAVLFSKKTELIGATGRADGLGWGGGKTHSC